MSISGLPVRYLLCVVLAFLALNPSSTLAANQVNLRSESLVRFFERDTVTENDALIIPAYEYLKVDFGDIEEETLTFHANGWGRIDVTDNDYFEDQTSGELLYGYLEFRPTGKNLTARLGRQHIFSGVANESVDGIYLDMSLPSAMSVSVYAGQPMALDSTNGRSGDSIYGGRFGLRLDGNVSFGVSYKLIENDSNDAEEMAGIDYGIMLNNIFISGFSSYNLITEDFAEHSFDAVLNADQNRIRVFYQMFTFEDYFGTGDNNANPFRVLALTAEELSSYGAELTRRHSDSLEIGIKFSRSDYDIEEASHYGALLANWYGETTSYGGELGVSEGENGRNDMVLARGYVTTRTNQSRIVDRISLDLLYAVYDQPIFNEDTSIFAAVTGTRKLSDRLLLKLAADFESNPYYDSDVRGLVSLVYNYSAN